MSDEQKSKKGRKPHDTTIKIETSEGFPDGLKDALKRFEGEWNEGAAETVEDAAAAALADDAVGVVEDPAQNVATLTRRGCPTRPRSIPRIIFV